MIRRSTYLLMAAFALALAGCGDSSHAPDSTSAAPPPSVPVPSRPSAPPAAAKPSEPNDVLSVLSVEHQVDLSSERDGVVTSIAKDEGAAVKAGEILGQLDDRTLQMELNKARNDLVVAENNVKFKEAELKAKAAALRRQH